MAAILPLGGQIAAEDTFAAENPQSHGTEPSAGVGRAERVEPRELGVSRGCG